MIYLISVLAGLISGIIGSMGFGGGGILIIFLTFILKYSQIESQGINLIFFIPCAIMSTIIYSIKRLVKYKEIYPFILGGLFGSIIFSFIVKEISDIYLRKIFGAFMIISGVFSLIRIKKKNDVVIK